MRRTMITLVAATLVAAGLTTAGCSGSTAPAAKRNTLTASEAAVLQTRMAQFATLHPQLEWLADSSDLVVRAGARMDTIPLTTDLGAGPYYALALQRAVFAGSNSASTFHLIAFNDPGNPTEFLVVGGHGTATGQPPQSVSGQLGSTAASAHLLKVTGSTVAHWRATDGVASFTRGVGGAACTDVVPPAGVTCAQTPLTLSFTITIATREGSAAGSEVRTASLPQVSVPGILLTFQSP